MHFTYTSTSSGPADAVNAEFPRAERIRAELNAPAPQQQTCSLHDLTSYLPFEHQGPDSADLRPSFSQPGGSWLILKPDCTRTSNAPACYTHSKARLLLSPPSRVHSDPPGLARLGRPSPLACSRPSVGRSRRAVPPCSTRRRAFKIRHACLARRVDPRSVIAGQCRLLGRPGLLLCFLERDQTRSAQSRTLVGQDYGIAQHSTQSLCSRPALRALDTRVR